ncbi:type VII secretion-associated serine protease mycosin [Streptomyces sp. URMC 126]|uniref:type VII secretion-associated serine protease mycosin n=1 Tax=Streptomyces sp. URMC 126 TaxID=3423401 RepID=UPI003F1C6A1F
MKTTGACRRVLVVASVLGSLLAVCGPTAPSALAAPVSDGQWYLETLQAERMWEKTTGEGVTVAVVDGGVRASHPDLRGKVLPGKDFAGGGGGTGDNEAAEAHGTTMAALIAGGSPDGQGIKGLAPGARILPVKVRTGIVTAESFAKAIRYAADSDAKIINVSIGRTADTADGKYKALVQGAVDYANKRGKLIFASSGNDGRETNLASYPAATRGVVAISAVDSRMKMAKFSTHGPQVALAAPGVDIPTVCDKPPGYCHGEGTSHASAIASASAALIWSLHPKWTGNQVLRVLIETAGKPTYGKIPSDYIGYGTIRPRLNVLENKGDPGPPDVNPLLAAADDKNSAKSAVPTAPVTHEPAGATGKKDKGKGGEDDNLPWFIGGAAAIAVPGAVLLALMVRRSRRKAEARKRQQQAQAAAMAGPYGGTTPVQPPYPPQDGS